MVGIGELQQLNGNGVYDDERIVRMSSKSGHSNRGTEGGSWHLGKRRTKAGDLLSVIELAANDAH